MLPFALNMASASPSEMEDDGDRLWIDEEIVYEAVGGDGGMTSVGGRNCLLVSLDLS